MDGEDEAMLRAIGRHVRAHALDAFIAQGRSCGWCRRPIRLRGAVSTGEGRVRTTVFTSAALPDGVVLKACGARRETVCPSCAVVYRDDARHLVRAGLVGGKGVDVSVATHPTVFVTLTAPSFGAVHTIRDDGTCQPGDLSKRCPHRWPNACAARHRSDDTVLGAALCPDCYDYRGAVLHNASTPELWRRTTIYASRHLASTLGVTQGEARRLVRLSALRVAELQRRCLVHLHAIVRADRTDGTAPSLGPMQLAIAVETAARAVRVPHRHGVARWGVELDVQVLKRDDGQERKVATYIAKYATKSSTATGALDHSIRSAEDLGTRALRDHERRMVETAWQLGAEPGLAHLRRHAHTLGYGGHFLAKSPTYSTTFTALRTARSEWNEARRSARTGRSRDRSVTSRWRAVGAGWANEGEALFAGYRRQDLADERRAANEDRYWWYESKEEPRWQ